MSEMFKSIKRGLEEAVAYSKGERPRAIVHEFTPLDVKKLRTGLDMSQTEFAAAFGISVSTLRDWERGDRPCSGAAQRRQQGASGGSACAGTAKEGGLAEDTE